MKFRLTPPAFWHKPTLLGNCLAPIGNLYGAFSALLQSQTVPFRPSIPVICVGNATLGGAGKTPITLALTALLQRLSETPHILSRGYGAEIISTVRVNLQTDTPQTVGDEPLLLARAAPTWANPNRGASARLAMMEDASLLLLDDGLQHGGITRDTSFLVIDTDYGLGNGHIIPAGPLREKLESVLEKSHAIIALGHAPLALPLPHTLPVFKAKTIPSPAWESMRNQYVFAFSGLANNEKFFRMCKSLGMHVVDSAGFPDHHPYTRADVKLLLHRAHLLGATPVTTEKDAVKLTEAEREKIVVLPITIAWENEAAITAYLQERLRSFRAAPPTLLYEKIPESQEAIFETESTEESTDHVKP